MSQANYMSRRDESRLHDLRVQLLDYLFDKGHRVNKPMIDDLALFVYDLNQAMVAQGQMQGSGE